MVRSTENKAVTKYLKINLHLQFSTQEAVEYKQFSKTKIENTTAKALSKK